MPFDFTTPKPEYDLVNSKADRLRYLADFMEGLRDDQVWMPGYVHDCGTARCALGWAVTLPAFRALGIAERPDVLHFHSCVFFGCRPGEGISIWMARAYPYPEDAIPAAAVAARLREAADIVAARELAEVTL